MKNVAEQIRQAALTGKAAKVRALIPAADQHARDQALVDAVCSNKTEAAIALLESGANSKQRAAFGSLLSYAAAHGNLELVKAMVKVGADVNWMVSRVNPLMSALDNHRDEVVKFLEARGATAPPNARLFAAAESGNVQRAKQALDDGAEIEKTGGTFSETPLMIAARRGRLEVVKLLIKRGANVNRKNDAQTALHNAVAYGKSLEVAKALVAAGADVKTKYSGGTMLMSAAAAGQLDIAKWLVEQGVDPNVSDPDEGMTALDHARRGKTPAHKKVAEFLSGLGAETLREGPRLLMRALAKEFGGRPVEYNIGFMFDSKLANHRCEFAAHAEGGRVSVTRMRLVSPELRKLNNGALIFANAKPDRTRGKMTELRDAGKALKMRIWLEGEQLLSQDFVTKYFKPLQKLLADLKLTGEEHVVVGPRAISFVWRVLDVSTQLPRVKLFEDFVRAIAAPAQPEKILFAKEWLLKPASKSEAARARHSFGGKWTSGVACPDCAGATNLMAQIDLSDPALGKTKLGLRKLPIFWCLTCLEWGPAFYDISKGSIKSLDQNGNPMPAAKLEKGEDDLPHQPATLTPVAKGGRKTKIGGKPGWVQGEQTPDCPKCRSRMAFALQLASGKHITYADMGNLYAFICLDCEILATLIQSH